MSKRTDLSARVGREQRQGKFWRYSAELRSDIVSAALEAGRNGEGAAAFARSIGVSAGTLDQWLRSSRAFVSVVAEGAVKPRHAAREDSAISNLVVEIGANGVQIRGCSRADVVALVQALR